MQNGCKKTQYWENDDQMFPKGQTSFLVWSYLWKSWEDKFDKVEDYKLEIWAWL